MSRVVAIAALCLFLAGCQDGLGSTSAGWENWERHSLDVATISDEGISGGDVPFATFGAELSLPEEFVRGAIPGDSEMYGIDEAQLPQDQTIATVFFRLSGSGLQSFSVSDMDPVMVGEREYSGYKRISSRNNGNALVEVIYLAGGQWWILQGYSTAESLTDSDEELLESILASIDHG